MAIRSVIHLAEHRLRFASCLLSLIGFYSTGFEEKRSVEYRHLEGTSSGRWQSLVLDVPFTLRKRKGYRRKYDDHTETLQLCTCVADKMIKPMAGKRNVLQNFLPISPNLLLLPILCREVFTVQSWLLHPTPCYLRARFLKRLWRRIDMCYSLYFPSGRWLAEICVRLLGHIYIDGTGMAISVPPRRACESPITVCNATGSESEASSSWIWTLPRMSAELFALPVFDTCELLQDYWGRHTECLLNEKGQYLSISLPHHK